MPSIPTDVVDRLRRQEYTGENRCMACTGVNLILAAVAAGTAGGVIALYTDQVVGTLLGGALLFVCLTAIYLRGYLVPGTPHLTKTYFPDRVLRWFDKESTVSEESRESGEQAVDVEHVLYRAGAVTECDDRDDLCLTDAFRRAWRSDILDLREGETARDALATVLDMDPDQLSFEDHGDGFVAHLDGDRVGQWPSRAAFLADTAAARVLREEYGPWSDLAVRDRSTVLNGLRIFLEQCPACDGRVTADREVVESCCRSVDVIAVTCQDCGARVFEAEQPE